MALDFQAVVDWDNDKFFHRYANANDAPNLFGTLPILMTTMRRQMSAGSVTDVPYGSGGESLYGREYIIWTTSIGLSPTIDIGYNGTTYDLGTQPGGDYTAIVWLRSQSASYDAVKFTIKLMRGSGTIVAAAQSLTVKYSSGWKRFKITGTNPGTNNLYIQIQKDNNATDCNIRIAGAMIYSGSANPTYNDGYNSGGASLYDNITQFAKSGRWMHGFSEPYKDVANAGRASFALKNVDKTFSPEYASSPLYGLLRPQRQLRIFGESQNQNDRMWTGWIESIKPQPGVNGTRECVIEAVDARKFLDGVDINVPTPIDMTAKQICREVLGYVSLPPSDSSFTPTLPPPEDYEEIFPYALDNHPDGMDALRALREVIGTVQGKIYFDRDGQVNITDLYNWGKPSSLLWLTLNDEMAQMDYRYGERIINDVTCKAYKRKVSAASDKILWDADETIEVDPWETEEIRATIKNPDTDSSDTISGLNMYLEYDAVPSGVSITATYGSNRVDIVIVNGTGSTLNVTGLKVRGKKLTAFGEFRRRKKSDASIAEFGTRAKEFDYKLMNLKRSARRFAADMVVRFSQPRGEVVSISFVPKTTAQQDNMVAALIGRMVRVQESHSSHDDYYSIIGEEISAVEGMKKVICKWFLEPVYRGLTLDDDVFGMIDGSNHLSLY